jgi:hypothetical protein
MRIGRPSSSSADTQGRPAQSREGLRKFMDPIPIKIITDPASLTSNQKAAVIANTLVFLLLAYLVPFKAWLLIILVYLLVCGVLMMLFEVTPEFLDLVEFAASAMILIMAFLEFFEFIEDDSTSSAPGGVAGTSAIPLMAAAHREPAGAAEVDQLLPFAALPQTGNSRQ